MEKKEAFSPAKKTPEKKQEGNGTPTSLSKPASSLQQ